MYSCKRCGYATDIKGNLKNHFKRKRKCKCILSDISIETLKSDLGGMKKIPSKIPQKSSKILKIPQFESQLNHFESQLNPIESQLNHFESQLPKKNFKCPYCEKGYSRHDNLKRHISKFCKNRSINNKQESDLLEVIKEMKEERAKDKEERAKEIAELKKHHALEIERLLEQQYDRKNGVQTNIKTVENMSNKVENNNNKVENMNIIINNYGNENLEYISGILLQNLLRTPYSSIPKLIKVRHFHPNHPENHNIKITNKKLPYANVWNNNKWVLKDKKEVIDDLVDKSYNMIDTEYDNGHLDGKKKENYKRFQIKFDNKDKGLHKQLKRDTELLLINESDNMV